MLDDEMGTARPRVQVQDMCRHACDESASEAAQGKRWPAGVALRCGMVEGDSTSVSCAGSARLQRRPVTVWGCRLSACDLAVRTYVAGLCRGRRKSRYMATIARSCACGQIAAPPSAYRLQSIPPATIRLPCARRAFAEACGSLHAALRMLCCQ